MKKYSYLFHTLFLLPLNISTTWAQSKGILPAKGDPLYEKVKEGTIELSDIPLFILQWIDYLTYLAGSIAVIMIIVGGYQYMIGSITDDKERGKKTLMYALVGVAVTFSAWILVNWIQTWITS